jgi:intracellular sulfur oxidation DsrE/DsrF family protein
MVLLGRSVVAQDYQALKGVESVKAVFDVRSGDPMNVFGHLQLIHETFKGDSIRQIDSDPKFAVVFTDKSVLLLSQDRNGHSEKEIQILKKMDQLVSAMAQEGITLEVCLFALDYFDVDQKSVTKAVTRVPNGWISTIGYQSRGYSLVPVY